MFDFLKGKIDINLSKLEFSKGETISGTVFLNLKKPVKARALYVSLIGEKKVVHTTGRGSSTRTVTVFEFEKSLDGKKEYLAQPYQYSFEIKAPSFIDSEKPPEGTIGTLIKTFQSLSGIGVVKWYIEAKLDIPLGIDIRKRVQINL